MNNEVRQRQDIIEVLIKEKTMLTKKELSKILGVSRTTIDNYMKRDDNPLEFIKFGKSDKAPVRFQPASVAMFLYNNNKESHNG